MKRKNLLILALFAIFIACGESDKEPQFKKTATSSKIIAANNDFAFTLFKEISAEEKENYMVSPVSLSLAMGMLYNGSNGVTSDIMSEGLGYKNLDIKGLSQINKNIIDNLVSDQLKIANSNWIREGFEVKQDFINLNKEYYYAEVKTEDFGNPNTIEKMNDWASDNTNQKIKEIITEIPGNAIMYLMNAIYFNADWEFEFKEENTHESEFYPENSQRKMVDMMHMKTDKINYLKNDLFSSVVLPYKNEKFSMTILLPNDDKSTDDIVENLSSSTWENWQNNYEKTELNLSLPKFKFQYENTLNDELINMGFGNLFGNPDLTGIADARLKISKVLQKTFVDVNEIGTEAAAVTIIGIEVTSLPIIPQVNCDKPFLFVISEKNTNSICFIGKVGNPEYSE